MRMPLIPQLNHTVLQQNVTYLERTEPEPHAALAEIDTIHAVDVPRDRTPVSERAMNACKAAWEEAYKVAQEKGLPAAKALRHAQIGYKLALPKMDSLPSIRAAIACIAQGIALEVFDGRDGSQLLYAAQVALSLVRKKEATN